MTIEGLQILSYLPEIVLFWNMLNLFILIHHYNGIGWDNCTRGVHHRHVILLAIFVQAMSVLTYVIYPIVQDVFVVSNVFIFTYCVVLFGAHPFK